MRFPKNSGNPRLTKKCEHCGDNFRTRNPNKKYCSDDCSQSAKNARAYERKVDTGGMNSVLEETHG